MNTLTAPAVISRAEALRLIFESDRLSAIRLGLSKYALKEGYMTEDNPLWNCGRNPYGFIVRIAGRKSEKGVVSRWIGVMRCHNVWACPVCSTRISVSRVNEVKQSFEVADGLGYKPFLLTITLSHKSSNRLSTTLSRLTESWNEVMRDGTVRRWLKKNTLGTIANLEVTYSKKNGWHPHRHIILYARKNVTSDDIISVFEPAYLRRLKSNNARGIEGHAFHCQEGDSAHSYVSKLAEELVLSVKKTGSGDHLSIWGVARHYPDLFYKVFVPSIKGKRALVWSKGLKDLLHVDSVSDEEIMQQSDELNNIAMYSKDYLKLSDEEREFALEIRSKHEDFESFLSEFNREFPSIEVWEEVKKREPAGEEGKRE